MPHKAVVNQSDDLKALQKFRERRAKQEKARRARAKAEAKSGFPNLRKFAQQIATAIVEKFTSLGTDAAQYVVIVRLTNGDLSVNFKKVSGKATAFSSERQLDLFESQDSMNRSVGN